MSIDPALLERLKTTPLAEKLPLMLSADRQTAKEAGYAIDEWLNELERARDFKPRSSPKASRWRFSTSCAT